MLWELYVSFGVATVLFILFNKKFIQTAQSLPDSPDILCTEPMGVCSPVSPQPSPIEVCSPVSPQPTPMDTSPDRFTVQPMSENESSSEEFVIKEKYY